MIKQTIKKPLRHIKNKAHELYNSIGIKRRIKEKRTVEISKFDYEMFRSRVLRYIKLMQTDDSGIYYKYSGNCTKPTLYASIYACMTQGMLGALAEYSDELRRKWVNYFDSFQDAETGLFYDPVVANDIFLDTDWWGARHLALHIIIAYADLGAKPTYPFRFLKRYYDTDYLIDWLRGVSWNDASIGLGDIDNKIMNIGCLLQYQRDYWEDAEAGAAVDFLKSYLKKMVNPYTQLWGPRDLSDKELRSRIVQFGYHLLPMYFYDRDFCFAPDKIVETVLNTQNAYGGFGVRYNSSACEDIDSIELLIRLRTRVDNVLSCQIDQALNKAFTWVLLNQMDDGGFVFRLNESFKYGHKQMSSTSNQGAMFPTWFRCLCVKRILSTHDVRQDDIRHLPGYVVKLQ